MGLKIAGRTVFSSLPIPVPDDDFTSPTFLKTDTQGFDLHVLRGAGDRLGSFVGVQTEGALMPSYCGAPTFREVLDFMELAGFNLTGVYPVAVSKRMLRLLEADSLWRNG